MSTQHNRTEAAGEDTQRTSTVVWLFQRGVRSALCLIAVLAAAASIVLGAGEAQARELSGIDSPEVSTDAARKAGEIAARYPEYRRPEAVPTPEALATRGDRPDAGGGDEASAPEEDPGVLRSALASIVASDSLPFVDVGGAMAAGGYEPGEIFAVTQGAKPEDEEEAKEEATPSEDFVRPVLNGDPELTSAEPEQPEQQPASASTVPPASNAPLFAESEEPSGPATAEPEQPEDSRESGHPTFIVFPQEGFAAPPADDTEEEQPPADGYSQTPPQEELLAAEDDGADDGAGDGGLLPAPAGGAGDGLGGGNAGESTDGGASEQPQEDQDDTAEVVTEPPAEQEDAPGADFGLLPETPGKGDESDGADDEDKGNGGPPEETPDEAGDTIWGEDPGGEQAGGKDKLNENPNNGQGSDQDGGQPGETAGEIGDAIWGSGSEDTPEEDAPTQEQPDQDEPAGEEEEPGRITPEPPSNKDDGAGSGAPDLDDAFGGGGGSGQDGSEQGGQPQDDQQQDAPAQNAPEKSRPDEGGSGEGEPDEARPGEDPPADQISAAPASIGEAFRGDDAGGRSGANNGGDGQEKPESDSTKGKNAPAEPAQDESGGSGNGPEGKKQDAAQDASAGGGTDGENQKGDSRSAREPAPGRGDAPDNDSPAGIGAAFETVGKVNEPVSDARSDRDPANPGDGSPAADRADDDTEQGSRVASAEKEASPATLAEAMGTTPREPGQEEEPEKDPALAPAGSATVAERRTVEPAPKADKTRGVRPSPDPRPEEELPVQDTREASSEHTGQPPGASPPVLVREPTPAPVPQRVPVQQEPPVLPTAETSTYTAPVQEYVAPVQQQAPVQQSYSAPAPAPAPQPVQQALQSTPAPAPVPRPAQANPSETVSAKSVQSSRVVVSRNTSSWKAGNK